MVLFSSLSFDSWTCRVLARENQCHILDAESKHIPPSGKPCSSSPGCCYLMGTIIESSKGHSISLSGQLLQDGRNNVRPVNSMTVAPLSHVSGYEVSSLVRSNTVKNAIMVDKVFCK